MYRPSMHRVLDCKTGNNQYRAMNTAMCAHISQDQENGDAFFFYSREYRRPHDDSIGLLLVDRCLNHSNKYNFTSLIINLTTTRYINSEDKTQSLHLYDIAQSKRPFKWYCYYFCPLMRHVRFLNGKRE